MTAPSGLREQLAEAIRVTGRTRRVDSFPLADALLPVVERWAARKAAEELRAAADSAEPWQAIGIRDLRARASALDPTTEEAR